MGIRALSRNAVAKLDPSGSTFLSGSARVVSIDKSEFPDLIVDGNPTCSSFWIRQTVDSSFLNFRIDAIFQLFLTLLCTCALASVPEDAKQQKRGIVSNDGWVGLPSPYGYGHGHPWMIDHAPWKGLKLPEVNLHSGLHLAGALPTYGKGGIALTPGIVKTLPVYITKHVVLEKPVPVPEPVIIEKPYHVPVEKVIPVPIEKIIHRPVPIPIPVPQAVPFPVEHPIPIPVKHPVAVPVQQPYPVAVKHPVPVPVPVPVPIPVHSAPLPVPVHSAPLLAASGLAGAIYTRGYAHSHPFASLHLHPSMHLHGHGLEALSHGFGQGIGHVLPHGYGHGYGYSPSYHDAHVDHLVHAHDHKKRKTDKN
ncbi:SH3 domain-containing protein C23A1.17-like [Odontomachus brunneus]|uniref:SH3 domain-containing protein C23A1.17-like n=1 Tax=Odontomachus brunneus TaxID=486640 RepID=UPI0013F1B1D5|nr:SH3 domain-containing protein C23A1.17-like [Odontomachus brunneus]